MAENYGKTLKSILKKDKMGETKKDGLIEGKK